jgi:hypothetical protein
MKAALIGIVAALLGGCAARNAPQAALGASAVGAPELPVGAAAIDQALRSAGQGPHRADVRLPERIVLPAAYRLMLLDGHLTLVRDTDPQVLEPSPMMQIVPGDTAPSEAAYQPALLPQELAAAAAADRESSARMDNALESVMRRSRELAAQAMELQAQERRLAEVLAASEERVRQLESAAKGVAAPRAAAPAEPNDER